MPDEATGQVNPEESSGHGAIKFCVAQNTLKMPLLYCVTFAGGGVTPNFPYQKSYVNPKVDKFGQSDFAKLIYLRVYVYPTGPWTDWKRD